MQPNTFVTHQPSPSSHAHHARATRPGSPSGPKPKELPPVTDWDHFAAWCHQKGRQALPASDETLTLYFRDQRSRKRQDPSSVLGALALACAILGVLAPAVTVTLSHFAGGNLRLALVSSGLFFLAFQIIALGTAWPSRRLPTGRAAWTIALLSVGVATALTLLVFHQGGLNALETFLASAAPRP